MELSKSILLVDDSAVIRRSLRRAFEENGWDVRGEAGNGQEAIDVAQQLNPQVILLDLAMPGMNGITAARVLKRLLPDTYLMLFSLHADLVTPEQVHSSAFSAVVSKTESLPLLIEKAESLLKNAA